MYLKAKVQLDKKTKNLVKRLKPGEIAIIDHCDIDEVAAESLVNAKVKAVINASKFISGKYPNQGPKILHKAGIFMLDNVGKEIFDLVKNGDEIEIIDNEVYYNGNIIAKGMVLTGDVINYMQQEAQKNLEEELDKFIENTLEYAKKEKYFITENISIPPIKTRLRNRHALVVVRGKEYKEDLMTIRSYIQEVKPVLIGVDGGADALLEFGFKPDIVVGDMDSISDRGLLSSKEIVVHAYPDGRAPGLKRVKELGLQAHIFPAPGTSEDIAMLLAYEKGADLIVAVGSHSSMIDFLEKGRKGMASTFLVRLKIGSKLVDAKGVNKLYRSNIKMSYIIGLLLSALMPIIIISMISTPMQQLFKIIALRIKLIFGL